MFRLFGGGGGPEPSPEMERNMPLPPGAEPQREAQPERNQEAQETPEYPQDIDAEIFIPSKINEAMTRYVEPQRSNWRRDIEQFDFEQAVDPQRAKLGQPPLNPARKHRDHVKMVENFRRFDTAQDRLRQALRQKVVPRDLIGFIDWRLAHKTGHLERAQAEGDKRGIKRHQREIDELNGWKQTILKQCPLREEQRS